MAFRKASKCESANCVEVDTEFRTASACNVNECVEVATGPDLVAVRDSKDQSGPVLAFTPKAWNEFLEGLKS